MAEEVDLFDGIGDLNNFLDAEVVDSSENNQIPDNKQELNTQENNQTITKDNIDSDNIDFGLGEINETNIQEDNINKESEDASKTSSPSTTPYVFLAENLHNRGILASLSEEEIEEAFKGEDVDPDEALLELHKIHIDRVIERKLESLSEDERAIYEGKKLGVPLDQLGQIDNAIKSYENINETYLEDNIEIAKKLVTADLQSKGIEADEIDIFLDKYEEDNILINKAIKAKNSFVDGFKSQKTSLLEEAKQTQKNREIEIENYKKELKQVITNTSEIIPGVKLNKEIQDLVYDDLTKPVRVDEKTNQPVDIITDVRNKNPKGFDFLLRYYNRIGLFNIDDDGNLKPDFSLINNKLADKEAKNIKKILDTDSFIPSNKTRNNNKDSSINSIFDGI